MRTQEVVNHNPEEAQKKFLTKIHEIAETWAIKPGEYSVPERCHGVAHAVLSVIDGAARGMPAFELVPIKTEEPIGLRESDKPWPSDPLNASTLLAPQYANTYDASRQGMMLASVDLFD